MRVTVICNRRMRQVAVLLIAVLAAAVAAVTAAHAEAASRNCGTVVFTANTEDGAGNIKVTGTTCRKARRVVQSIAPLSVTRGPYDHRALGFACHGTLHDKYLPIVHWRCTRGRALITFQRG